MRKNYDKSTWSRKDKSELIDSTIKNLENMIKALEEIKAGYAESKVCDKYGINKSNLRHLVFDNSKMFPGQENIREKYNVDPSMFMTGKEKLYSVLLDTNNIPYDAEETIEYCLKHSNLNGNQIKVLRMRYWENMTLEETGSKMGLTKERVRQIESVAIVKIQKYHKKLLACGIVALKKYELMKKEEYLDQKKLVTAHLREIENEINKTEEEKNELSKKLPSNCCLKEKTIHDFMEEKSDNMSIRLYNALRRNIINNQLDGDMPLSKLNGYSKKEFFNLRNFGVSVMREFEWLLAEEGIHLGE